MALPGTSQQVGRAEIPGELSGDHAATQPVKQSRGEADAAAQLPLLDIIQASLSTWEAWSLSGPPALKPYIGDTHFRSGEPIPWDLRRRVDVAPSPMYCALGFFAVLLYSAWSFFVVVFAAGVATVKCMSATEPGCGADEDHGSGSRLYMCYAIFLLSAISHFGFGVSLRWYGRPRSPDIGILQIGPDKPGFFWTNADKQIDFWGTWPAWCI